MKIKKYLIISILLVININVYSQTFSDEYRKSFDKTWKSEIPEIAKKFLKEEMNKKIELYKSIFIKKGLNIDSLSKFILVNEKYKSGFAFKGKLKFTFQLKNDSILINKKVSKKYKKLNTTEPISIIYYLLRKKKYNELENYARNELPFFEKGKETKNEYEIIIFDKKAEKKLRVSYIHEFITEIFKR